MARCAPLDVFRFADNADLPFDMDWSDWLDGATIVSAVWSVDAVGGALVELHTPSLESGLTVARTWIRGRSAGSGQAFVSATVTASDGRVDAQTWQLEVCGID